MKRNSYRATERRYDEADSVPLLANPQYQEAITMNRLLGICVGVGVAFAVTFLVAPAGAQQAHESIDLFAPTVWPAGEAAAEEGATPVVVDLASLKDLAAESRLRLSLSPNVAVNGAVDRVEKRSLTQYSVFGRIDDDLGGFFIIVVEEDVAVGMIDLPALRQAFSLGYVADGVHAIAPIDQSKFPECATTSGGGRLGLNPDARLLSAAPDRPQNENDGEGGFLDLGGCPAPRRHFDVMIYYTPAARTEAGGTNAIRAECQLAVDTTNQTYINSGIPARIVLVLRALINYNETNNVRTDRNRLTDPDDGFMDGVHAGRNSYGGDFVCLFVDNSDPDSCGVAYCTPSGPERGFCVVQRGCASNNLTFPHEIGHLQGCAHNRADAGSGCNFYCDSYGHRFAGNTGDWRTVMSYNDGPGTYTRIAWFSNPLVNFDGVPTGAGGDCDSSTNNAGTIFGTTVGREDWRNPRFEVWVDFGTPGSSWEGTYQVPWPTVASGVAAVYGLNQAPYAQPRLIIKAGATNETPTISKPMRIEACGGTVRIGA